MNAPENSFGVEIAGQSIIVALFDLFARSVLLWTFRRSGLYRLSPRDIRQIECESKEVGSDHVRPSTNWRSPTSSVRTVSPSTWSWGMSCQSPTLSRPSFAREASEIDFHSWQARNASIRSHLAKLGDTTIGDPDRAGRDEHSIKIRNQTIRIHQLDHQMSAGLLPGEGMTARSKRSP